MEKNKLVPEVSLIEKIKEYTDLEWFIAMGASEFKSVPIERISEVTVEKLYELRAFNKNHEIRVLRGNLGEEFQLRDSIDYKAVKVDDITNIDKDNSGIISLTENHYLDVDTKKGYVNQFDFVEVSTMAGGSYGLPNQNTKKVEIENYYRSDEKGFYHPFDYRIVRFMEEVRA